MIITWVVNVDSWLRPNKCNLNIYSISAHIESNEIKSCLSKSLGLTIDETLSWSKHIDNISKKISSGTGALKCVRTFINTHSATKIHQALTLNDKRNWAISRRSRPKTAEKCIMIPTHSCSLVIKPTIFYFLLLFVSAFALLLFSASAAVVFTFLLLSTRWIPQRIRKRR